MRTYYLFFSAYEVVGWAGKSTERPVQYAGTARLDEAFDGPCGEDDASVLTRNSCATLIDLNGIPAASMSAASATPPETIVLVSSWLGTG